jgi:hypothetical protein
MTTDNTVAEIEAARGTALGIELDRHLSVQPSDSRPPLWQPHRLLNRAHDSDALLATVNAVGGAPRGTESTDPDLKPFRPNKGHYLTFIFA